jgi:hypothetical protein
MEVLDEAQALVGDSVDLRLARAKLWAADWQPTKVERVRSAGRHIEHLADGEQIRLLAGLGEICANIGDRVGAKECYSGIAARQPKELAIRLALFELAARDKDEKLLQRLRREIAALQLPGSEFLAVAEALAFDTMDRKLAEKLSYSPWFGTCRLGKSMCGSAAAFGQATRKNN